MLCQKMLPEVADAVVTAWHLGPPCSGLFRDVHGGRHNAMPPLGLAEHVHEVQLEAVCTAETCPVLLNKLAADLFQVTNTTL